jgi:hypothetical protein
MLDNIRNSIASDTQPRRDATAQRRSEKSRATLPAASLDQPGRLRVAQMLILFAVAHATFYAGLKAKKYPKPDGNDGRPFWKTNTQLEERDTH